MNDDAARFRASLAAWRPKLQGRLDAVVRRIVMTVAHEVIIGGTYGPGTPIRTGFARASWYVSVGSPSRETPAPEADENAGPGAYGDGSDAFSDINSSLSEVHAGGPTVYLLNDASYIRSLEYGSSLQAPAGMVRVVLSAIQGITDDIAKDIANGGDGDVLGVAPA